MIDAMRLNLSVIAIIFTLLTAAQAQAQGACLNDRYDRTFFDTLKGTNFTPLESVSDNSLSLLLAECLGDPDLTLRDGIAYEGLAALLRQGRVSQAGIRRLFDKCAGFLHDEEDKGGFLHPFAALCLAEVARTDRITPHFSDEERANFTTLATDYLKSITDYRAFDKIEGWRHGVAHSADVLMQLSLNDKISVELRRQMLAAIATQVSPFEHFYNYGEPARLARPVLFIAMQGTIAEDEWMKWLTDISKPRPEISSWDDAFSSQAGLAKRHNLTAFLSALHLNATSSDNENVKALMPGLTAAIRELP